MKAKVSLTVTVALLLILSACGGGGAEQTPNKPTPPETEQAGEFAAAETIYQQKCMSCHGTDMQGRSGPNLQKVGSKRTEQEIADVVANGQNRMPAFKNALTEGEIAQLSTWLSSMK
ncbi:cytochrome c [Paenibacillaceae bacterium]|nr:cytochrome c [Paenibacillaceae bacterium]